MRALSLIILFVSGSANAQSVPSPNELLHIVDSFNGAFTSLVVAGMNNDRFKFFIDILMLSVSVFFYIRSVQEFTAGKINAMGFITTKILPMLLLFTFLDPNNYVLVHSTISSTAKSLGNLMQFLITGFDDFSAMVGALFIFMGSINIIGPEMSIFDMTISIILLAIIVFLLYKNILSMIIIVIFYLAFSTIGFILLMIMGLVLLPFLLIKELHFLPIGWVKAMGFMFAFAVVWKIIISISVIFVVAAFFGSDFLDQIIRGQTTLFGYMQHIIFNSTNQELTYSVNSISEMIVPLAMFAVALLLIQKAFELTQFVVTGFLSSMSVKIGG